ncbi:MAG: hypothetical protein HETSPECPRED_007280 [Heterodermia speciosa]|uniref:Uncharacterized protein n=1 Tax=Heterodermia speciosa TaxID=116794 RepID=A0A8H3IRQ3_9LECA|nr:MAG: hypothetical protein HETSPECPRED_007280 [Heterodermia speciosa]
MAELSKSSFPAEIDTVIVGNGPSALVLSFILHGNIPYYDSDHGHPDLILHQKLLNLPSLLDLDVGDLTAHFAASRLSYSTQALPVNVLLDTLIRPLADTDPGRYRSCVTWRHEPAKSVAHLVLGNTSRAGGQWADNPIAGSGDIGTLSYSEMLSLPGYSLIEHRRKRNRKCLEEFDRPSRREVAEYLAIYPEMVGINDSIHTISQVDGISRIPTGFKIASHGIRCKHLVLASGTFSHLIPARPLLQPLLNLTPACCSSRPPLLVVGSGFTAADVILSSAPGHRVLHIFKWAPDEHPSPLRACHPRAYPEYASVYRKMKLAAKAYSGAREIVSQTKRRKSNSIEHANGPGLYEGLPNTYITNVAMRDKSAIVTLRQSDGRCIEREVSAMQYVIGRRGSLDFIDYDLSGEILGPEKFVERSIISGKTLRGRAEESLELAANVFVIGSLTGDSLIRFAFGGCVFAAGEIIRRARHVDTPLADGVQSCVLDTWADETEKAESRKSEFVHTNGHVGLGQNAKPPQPL